MAVNIKTSAEIEKMRIAGLLAGEVLRMIRPHVVAGIATEEIDRICHDYIVNEQQAIPAPLNYRGYPKSICTSAGFADLASGFSAACFSAVFPLAPALPLFPCTFSSSLSGASGEGRSFRNTTM